MTVPFVSPWGQALFAGTSQLIAHPEPLTKGDRRRDGYGGTIGGFTALSASVIGITSEQGYYGDLPQSQQAVVASLPPWERDY
jgi:hypothetical protein